MSTQTDRLEIATPPPGSNVHYSDEEAARLGDEIYERDVRAKVEPGNHGKVVAIDLTSGAFTIGSTALAASKSLRAQKPNAEVWLQRIGERALHRIG
jgi:hypothetical protein